MPFWNINEAESDGGMTQVVYHLLSKHEAMSSKILALLKKIATWLNVKQFENFQSIFRKTGFRKTL
jgi:hypothetical protein